MRKSILLTGLILTVLLAAGCHKLAPRDGRLIMVHLSDSDFTKTVATTTSSLETSGGFVMDAYLAEDSYDFSTTPPTAISKHHIIAGSSANVVMSGGKWVISGEPKWVGNTATRFWCWHPVTSAGRTIKGFSTDSTVLNFSYKTPAPSATTSADDAQDLIFAYTSQTYDEALDNSTVNIKFHHALAQIKFAVSTTDGSFDSRLKIKNISIDNIYSSGDCDFTGSGGGTGSFTWGDQADLISHSSDPSVEPYGQNYDASFKTLPVSGWTSGTYQNAAEETYDIQTCTNAFYMIPQTLTSNATITVVFEDETLPEGEKTISITKALGTDTWYADHYYTYKINATVVGRKIHMDITLEEWSDREDSLKI